MTTTSDTKLSMKLLIDTKAGKVLFAEAEKDCVDFLFHILSLPVGTVINLLKEKGMNGCLPNLYESVENLKDTYIQPNQCKDILLKPKSSVGISSAPFLLLNGDVPTHEKTFYGCHRISSHLTVSDDPTAICTSCQNRMSTELVYVAPPVAASGAVKATGGFVKDVVTYMVADDLVVKPMSTISCIALLNKFNIRDLGVLKEEIVSFGMEEAVELLKASFESETVLTSVFMSRVKSEK
ncbi:uncharacterized protein LOC129899522 [Solanum dulcamara]|uniref:uncharacterized protein LOC129899522 n=1 Tax=Solanum dulcamara TaxID=45834 RepID=UPI002484E9F9|nr:uncharacterized protein LOC129899522 [Solanum dulcamara]XP_055830498.1 uncharacterized protein LOC129899522 [Solanum dulcamara]